MGAADGRPAGPAEYVLEIHALSIFRAPAGSADRDADMASYLRHRIEEQLALLAIKDHDGVQVTLTRQRPEVVTVSVGLPTGCLERGAA